MVVALNDSYSTGPLNVNIEALVKLSAALCYVNMSVKSRNVRSSEALKLRKSGEIQGEVGSNAFHTLARPGSAFGVL
jgi:hypothetical protein